MSTANLEARRAYFRALEEHWPEVLDGLLRDVLPLYEPRWHTEAKLRFLVIDRWEYFQQGTERKNLRDALQKWAAKFRITEAWILDAALETLLIYCPQVQPTTNAPREKGSVRFWRIPLDFHPVFTPAFDRAVWYPPQRGWWERWESFKSRMQHQFSSQLAEYRRMVELKCGIGREQNLHRDAGWTAKYQRGQTAIEIAEAEQELTGLADPEQVVFRAVSRFARAIGLNLRRRGRKRGKTPVQPKD